MKHMPLMGGMLRGGIQRAVQVRVLVDQAILGSRWLSALACADLPLRLKASYPRVTLVHGTAPTYACARCLNAPMIRFPSAAGRGG